MKDNRPFDGAEHITLDSDICLADRHCPSIMKNIFIIVLVLITVLHFTLTYPIISSEVATDISKIGDIFTMDAIKDILIRTLIFVLYWLVLYVNVMMVNFMQEERKKELVKRRKVQEDFTNVVTQIFDVTLDNNNFDADEENLTIVLSNMVTKLAQLSSLKPDECKRIYDYITHKSLLQ